MGEISYPQPPTLHGTQGTPAFADYLEGVAARLRDLKLAESPADRPIHEEVFSRLSETLTLRDEFIETVGWAMDLGNAAAYLPRLKRFFQGLAAFQGKPRDEGRWNDSWDDALAFATFELYLYLVALLLEREYFELTGAWLGMHYIEEGYQTRRVRYGIFSPSLRSFSAWNDQLTPQKWLSPIGQVLRNRATSTTVSWDSIRQADLTLWLKAAIDGEDWWPHTSPYGRYGQVFPMYASAEQDTVWEPLQRFLGVGSRKALQVAVREAWRRRPIRYPGGEGEAQETLNTSLNMRALFGPEE